MERCLERSAELGVRMMYCTDIDGSSWHRDGEECARCGFGVNEHPELLDGKGIWGEPLREKRSLEEDLGFAERHTE